MMKTPSASRSTGNPSVNAAMSSTCGKTFVAVAGRGLALVGIIFGSVVLHELGHALVSMRAGIPAKAIILLPIGGVTLLDETQRPLEPGILTWKRDIRIAVAGAWSIWSLPQSRPACCSL